MTELNKVQEEIYEAISKVENKYDFAELEDIKKMFPETFKDLSLSDFEALYKNNELEVIKKVFDGKFKGLSDKEISKFKPRGKFPIVGPDEYLKYARILNNADIFNNPYILDDNIELLDKIVQAKIKETFSVIGELDVNLMNSAINLVTDLKNKVINSLKTALGIKDKIFDNAVDKRNDVFNQNVTDKETVSEDMPKIPHQIRAFGEPRNTANPEYPYNHITMTPGGHIVEYDDTPQSPRVRIQHLNGSKLEVDGDGNQILKATQDKYDIVDENHYKYIKGHATEVTNKKAMKSYNEGVLYKTTNSQTYASERVHYNTPILSYTEMLLGKNAIFSNNVIVKHDITSKTAKVEVKLSAKEALIKLLKGDWGNILSRESTVAWDIGTGGGDFDTGDMPATPPENRRLINNSLQFKDGNEGNPTFIKPVKCDHPIHVVGGTIHVQGGVLYVDGSPYTP